MRLLIVGEHVLLMQGFAQLLKDLGQVEVCGSVLPAEAREALDHGQPDVVLADATQPFTALGWLSGLCKTAAPVPVVAVGPTEPGEALAVLRAGARGIVGRNVSGSNLLACVRAVQHGDWGIPRWLSSELVEQYLNLSVDAVAVALPTLTERESRILHLLARGQTTGAIAERLYLSMSAVQSEIRALARKLRVSNRVQIVSEAIRRGLLPAEEETQSIAL